MKDFPETDTFQDYRGKQVTFRYDLIDAGNVYSLRAFELTRGRHPRMFCAYDEISPWNALMKMRQRIPREMNTRYFSGERGAPFAFLNFDHFRGHITSDAVTGQTCMVVDGKKMSISELERVLSVYEGRHVEIRISEELFE